MKSSLKSFSKWSFRQGIRLVEPIAGFWTDPTGYLPNRVKMLSRNYEKFLIQSIFRVLPDHGVFVDVGANVGFISQQVARKFPATKIFAFEPNPRIYPILQRNLKAFPQCQPFHAGLGAKDGSLEFFHGEESCVGSFVREYTSQHPSNPVHGQITESKVQVATGDAMLQHVGTINVMKMDVEGYEIEVLRGMSKLLAAGVIKTIFFEFCPFAQISAQGQPHEIIHLLNQSGFAICEIEGESKGSTIDASNVAALITKLGDKGYTTLRASLKS